MLEVFHIDIGNGTTHGELLLGAETGDHHFVDSIDFLFLHLDVNGLIVALEEHFYILITDVGEDKRLIRFHLYLIYTVHIGDASQAGGILDGDIDANEGFTLGVEHLTGDFLLLGQQVECRAHKEHYHQ